MESSLAYPRGKEEKAETQKEGKNSKGEQTLGYVGVVNTVTSREDVPLRGSDEGYVFVLYMMFHENRVNAMALKKESDTRWSSRREPITVVHKHLVKIVEAVNLLALDAVSSPKTKSGAVSHLKEAELERRLQSMQKVNEIFGFLSPKQLTTLDNKTLREEAATTLANLYPHDLEKDELAVEIESFKYSVIGSDNLAENE
ncbi:hypothetical protein AVEN_113146-1 [Araneus ventricosus]|uniref:Uncharacterized protein n=2 Tax=Araneus ventricosus TaxID=182803 RepID=A0A4Y2TXI0_ARAVE|nr:hypothetical protein AVEN_113146-1 [Araneus ventricosus]